MKNQTKTPMKRQKQENMMYVLEARSVLFVHSHVAKIIDKRKEKKRKGKERKGKEGETYP